MKCCFVYILHWKGVHLNLSLNVVVENIYQYHEIEQVMVLESQQSKKVLIPIEFNIQAV